MAFALYKEEYEFTELDVARSTFFNLQPKSVLLLNDSP